MSTAQPITNRYQDFQVLNLSQLVHHVEGHGPYMVTQDGCDPNDASKRQCSFVLTRRGTWLHFYLYLTLPEKVRAQCAHWESIAAVLQHVESLPAHLTMESAASLQELIHASGFEPDAADAAGQALFRELQKRHGAKTTSPPGTPG